MTRICYFPLTRILNDKMYLNFEVQREILIFWREKIKLYSGAGLPSKISESFKFGWLMPLNIRSTFCENL